jgi:integrase
MPAKRVKLTEPLVRREPFTERGQRRVLDAELAGFYLVIGKQTKTYTCQTTVGSNGTRHTVKKTFGRAGEVTPRDARNRARAWLASLSTNGAHRTQPGTLTLRDAWDRFRADLEFKGRSPRTIELYELAWQHAAELMDVPIAELGNDPDRVARVFERVSVKRNGRGGKVIANRMARAIRATYRFAVRRRLEPGLPLVPPTAAFDFHPERRRSTALTKKTAPTWWAALQALDNPVRRAFHELLLLTGARPGSLKCVRWTDIDFEERRMAFESAKAGRSYSIPLSRQMLDVLTQLRGLDSEWVFPSSTGHIAEHKEPSLPSDAGSLRQTYRSAATAVGVPELLVRILMGHSLRGVSEGYVSIGALDEALVEPQEAVSTELLRWCAMEPVTRPRTS